MTERLYYNDPYRRTFDATVTAVSADGPRRWVTLDRTAFYPTSGGQPFDTGELNGLAVVDVADRGDEIVHAVEGEGDLVAGLAVHGRIDWPRRFDHMQQHTGQHVLSAAFERVAGVRTVGFHLGAGESTIDLARDVTAQEVAQAEDDANRVVWEDRPVTIRYATAAEAAALPLRKEPARAGTLRLIDIADVDLSACGGTHVATTGAIGIVTVPAWERFKGGTRVTFLCGGRALGSFRTYRDILVSATRLLSVAAPDLPATIERMLADARAQRKVESELRAELTAGQAEAMAAAAEDTPQGRLVAAAVDADAAGLKLLASTLAARSRSVAVLVSTSRPCQVVVARSADADVSARDVLASLASTFGGRGGGKPDLAQGGGFDADPSALLAEARRIIARST